MAKKKSTKEKSKTIKKKTATKETPKLEKEIKKIQKKPSKKVEKPVEETKTTTEKKTLNKYQKAYKNQAKKTSKNKQVVDVKEVIYNVVLNHEEKPPQKIKYIGLKEYINLKIKEFKNRKNKNKIDPKKEKELAKQQRRQEYKERLILNQQLEKKVQKIEKDYSKYNIVIRTLVKIYRNLHIVFNSIVLLSFIILIIGLFKTEVYQTSTIIYFGALALFLILVAISQNRYLSGKIFTIILTTGLIFATVKIQNTYDFIHIMNTNSYEYKTYYVVAIDNSINRSIYNINNKKVGVLEQVSDKTTKVLNTKIKNVTYLTYENDKTLFEDFYNQKYRAMIVNENQLKYLESNPNSNKKVKTLYEFKAVTKK